MAYATRDGAGDGAAVAGEDYTAASGTLSFKPGETQKSVAVAVTDDGLREGAETLTLHLSGAQGARHRRRRGDRDDRGERQRGGADRGVRCRAARA